MKNPEELRKLSTDKLNKMIEELKFQQQLIGGKFGAGLNAKNLRHQIARIKTIIKEREING